MNERNWVEETNPYFTPGDIQLFSGCCDDQTSADVQSAMSRPGGAMTTALCEVLRRDPCPTYSTLLSSLTQTLIQRGFAQRPMLTSSQKFGTHRIFLPDDILPNTNTTQGRVVRQKFPPKPRPVDPIMEEMLFAGAAGLACLCCMEFLFAE